MARLLLVFFAFLAIAGPVSADAPPSHIFNVAGYNQASQMVESSSGVVVVADTYNDRLSFVTLSGTGLFAINAAFTGTLRRPSGVAFDPAGNLYVADQFNHRIVKYNAGFAPIGEFGTLGTGPGQLTYPTNLAISPDGTRLYVTELGGNRVSMFSPAGTFLGSFGSSGTGAGQFDHPWGIAVEGTGLVYVADQYNHRIEVFSATGTYISQFGSFGTAPGTYHNPVGMRFDGTGDLYICDQLNNRVQKVDRNGLPLTTWGTFGYANGQFYNDWCVLPTSDGHIWVGDSYNYRLQVFGFLPTPTVKSTWGSVKTRFR